MKSQKFALLLTLLFLPSCGSLPKQEPRNVEDLTVLRMAVRKMAEPRYPAPVDGKTTMAEQKTLGNAYKLGVNLEDTNWLLNGDKRAIAELVEEATTYIEQSRNPCKWWNLRCRWGRRDR